MNPTGRILHLQRLSTEDGPGIRTTVFFKGCPLHCRWCHNPESLSPAIQVQWLEKYCLGCQTCVQNCAQSALQYTPHGVQRDLAQCTACTTCVEACPAGAQEKLGVDIDADSLVKELLKDRAFFVKSGGGVTLSGGEPLRQPEFAQAVAARLAATGISVALDTCGLALWDAFEAVLPYVDLVLYDLKIIDVALHRVWTSASNRLILENFHRLCLALAGRYPHKVLWVRTPLIPVATANPENLQEIGAFVNQELAAAGLLPDCLTGKPGVADHSFRWELCAFNNLCRDKYRRLGLEWEFDRTPLLTAEELNQAGEWARRSGLDGQFIFVTGAARL